MATIEDMILLKEQFIRQIHDARLELADLKMEKINKRAKAWEVAEGTVDQKKDFVRSHVSSVENQISVLEADVEMYYSQMAILDEKIELEYLKDE